MDQLSDQVTEQERPPVTTVDSSNVSETVIMADQTAAVDIDPDVLENNEHLQNEEDNRVANFKAEKGLINRGGFTETPEKRQTNESKKNDARALHHMIQRQQEMLSFKLDGQEMKISKEDFRKHLEKWHKEDTEKAKAALKRGDQKLYEQLTKQAEASAQLLKDQDMGKDVDPELVKQVIGNNPSRKGEFLIKKSSTSVYEIENEEAFSNESSDQSVVQGVKGQIISRETQKSQLNDASGLPSTSSFSKTVDGGITARSSRNDFNQAANVTPEAQPAEALTQEIPPKYQSPGNNMSAMY